MVTLTSPEFFAVGGINRDGVVDYGSLTGLSTVLVIRSWWIKSNLSFPAAK